MTDLEPIPGIGSSIGGKAADLGTAAPLESAFELILFDVLDRRHLGGAAGRGEATAVPFGRHLSAALIGRAVAIMLSAFRVGAVP